MRKLGLRALAGGLAVMMVASVFAPAQKANAADVLLIAPAPTAAASETTLYVTEDMVDEDGEIVISGGNYDRVVVSKEAAAKDIYFDQVTVGELVVESGSNSKIQLWEVDAEKVTVQEPELEELTIKDLLPLLSDPETQQTAINLYMENQAKNKKILNTAPSIVTKEDAKVDTLVVRANATLELKDGGVDEVALEASEKIDRAKVTLKNYNGDVSYKGGEAKNSMTLKNVDSRINKLTVEESNANNYFTVTAKDSVVLKAEIAGNADVSLNAPMGTVEVTEAATAAKVTVLGVADEMIVAANDAQVEVAPCGSVTAASVTGNNVDVVGGGVLVEVDITGEGAYVSTTNTKVEGVNTYIPPEPYKRPTAVFTDIDLVGGEGAVVTKNADGSSTVVYTPTYKTASFVVPESVDKNLIAAVDIELTYNGQFCVKLPGTTKADDYPGHGTTAPKDGTFTYSFSSSRDKLAQIDFMCLEAPIEITVKKITFQLLDEPREEEPLKVSAPKDLPENYLVYNVTDLEAGGYGYKTTEAENGGMTYTYEGQYQEVQYALPEALNVSDYSKMIVTMSYTSGEIAFKLLKEQEVDGEMKAVQLSDKSVWYGNKADDTKDIEVSLAGLTGTATHVGLMSGGPCEATVYRVAFVPKAGGGSQGGAKTTYTFNELEEVQLWEATTSVDATTGAITMTFPGQWKQAFYEIPNGIDGTKLESITFNGLVGSSYAIKLQTAEEFAAGGDAAITQYDTPVVQTGGSAVKYIVFMSNSNSATAEAPQVITVESVTFNLKKDDVKDTYTFNELEEVQLWEATTSVDATTGAITMTFPGQWKQAFYEIPAEIDGTKLKSITFNGLVGSSYAIKLQTAEEFAAGGDAAITQYDTPVVQTGGSAVKYIVFMSNSNSATAEAPQVITVESITFNLKKDGAKDTYTFNELREAQLWEATTSVDATTGAITMTFPGQWKQAFYEIPAEVDVTAITTITFNGLVGSSYAIKLQTAEEFAAGGDAAITQYDTPVVQTGGSAVKYIVFMSNSNSVTAEAPQVITVESVTFN